MVKKLKKGSDVLSKENWGMITNINKSYKTSSVFKKNEYKLISNIYSKNDYDKGLQTYGSSLLKNKKSLTYLNKQEKIFEKKLKTLPVNSKEHSNLVGKLRAIHIAKINYE